MQKFTDIYEPFRDRFTKKRQRIPATVDLQEEKMRTNKEFMKFAERWMAMHDTSTISYNEEEAIWLIIIHN